MRLIDILLIEIVKVTDVILVSHLDNITAIYIHSSYIKHKHLKQKKTIKYVNFN